MSKVNSMFKVGDKVIVHKPDDVGERPFWISGMDKLNGTVQVVQEVNEYGFIKFRGMYKFHPKWLEPVAQVSVKSFNLCDVVQHEGEEYVILSRRGGKLQCCTVEAYCEESCRDALDYPERWRRLCLKWESISSLKPDQVQFLCTYNKAIEDGLIKPEYREDYWYE